MRKIIDYKIHWCQSPDDIEELVLHGFDSGWELYGDPFICPDMHEDAKKSDRVVAQAMVRYEEPKNKPFNEKDIKSNDKLPPDLLKELEINVTPEGWFKITLPNDFMFLSKGAATWLRDCLTQYIETGEIK